MIWKYLEQNILCPKDLNWVQHCVSRMGLLLQDYCSIFLRWLNTVCARFTDSVSDAIKLALRLWYANTAVDSVIPQFHMKWIIKLSFDPK